MINIVIGWVDLTKQVKLVYSSVIQIEEQNISMLISIYIQTRPRTMICTCHASANRLGSSY